MDIVIDSLVIEVTRRCNMQCMHCLRGEAQNIDINKKYIDALFDKVSNIYRITFTGGEPTLNVDAIEYTLKKAIEKEICPSFWLATNGKVYSQRLVDVLLDYYAYCLDFGYGSEESCGLAVSLDKFHDEISRKNLYKYKGLAFYDDSKEFKDESKRILVNEGLAKINKIGVRNITPSEFYTEITDNTLYIEEFYLNAKGEILVDCDLSYETQDKCSYGNILNFDFMMAA